MATRNDIELVFKGIDQASGVIKGLENNLKNFERGVTNVTRPLSNLTQTLLAAEAALAGIAVAMGVTAYNASVKFESSVADLAKVWDEQSGSLDEYVASLDDTALQYGILKTDLVDVSTSLAQAGISGADAAELLNVALAGSVAGGQEVTTVIDQLLAAMAGFGVAAGDTADIVEVANQASNNFNVTMSDLFEGFQRIAPAAKTAGLDIAETAGALTAIAQTGIPAAEAARGLGTIFARLTAESKPVQEGFALLGLSTEELSSRFETSSEKLAFVAESWDTLTQRQQAQLAVSIAGADQQTKFIALMENWGDATAIAAYELDGMTTSLAEVESRLQTQQVVIDRARVAFGILSTTLGNEFGPSVTNVIEQIGEIFQALSDAESVEALAPLFESLNGLLADFSDTLAAVAQNLPEALGGVDFDRLAESISNLGGAFGELFGSDLSTVDGLRKALQGLADGIATLTDFTGGVIEVFPAFISGFQSVANFVVELGPDFAQLAGNIGGISTVINALLPNIDTLLLAFIAFGGSITKVLKPIGALVTLIGGPVGLAVKLGVAAGAALGLWAAFRDGEEDINKTAGDITKVADSLKFVEQASDVPGVIAYVDAFKEIRAVGDEAAATFSVGAENAMKQAEAFRETGKAANLTADELDLLIAQEEAAARAVAGVNESYATLGQAYIDVNNQLVAFNEEQFTLGETLKQTAEVVDASGRPLENYQLIISGTEREIVQLADAERTRESQLELLKKTTAEAAEETEKLSDAIKVAQIEAAKDIEIASIEAGTAELEARLESLTDLTKLKIDLDIAQLAADTEIAKATVEGIASSVEVVGGNIGDILKQMGAIEDTDKLAQQKFSSFQDQLDQETNIFNKLIDSQIAFQDAQTEALRERVKSLRSGQAIIEIDGKGLEPELEAFMWRILSNIQIRGNADAQAFLLGAT